MISISNRALANLEFYLQPGHNGPYNDPETPVRNYGHWLITFSKCFEVTGEQKYLDKINELADYIILKESRPFGFSFHHRSKEGKDKCNGLVGQVSGKRLLVNRKSFNVLSNQTKVVLKDRLLAKRLVRVGIEIESFMGLPQDIEWCVDHQ